MPFCKSCGNLLDLSKQRCGGCSLTIPQQVRDAASRTTPKKNTWTKKYCTPPPTTSPRTTTPTGAARSTQTTPTPTPSRPRTRSQLSRGASPPTASTSSPSPELDADDSRTFVDETQPIVPTHTGSSTRSSSSLAKVFGSLLQERTPESARCAACRSFFGRGPGEDRTIYPIPGSDPLSTDAFLCFMCFAARYKKDDCPTCSKPVLGLKNDPFVSAAGHDYHQRCYRCVRCLQPAHLTNVARLPSCNACFAAAPCCTAQEVAAVPQRPSDSLGGAHKPNATERLVLQFQSWNDVTPARPATSGPSVSDLKERFAFVNKELAQASKQPPATQALPSPSKQQQAAPPTDEFKIPRRPSSPPRGHRATQSTSSLAAFDRPALRPVSSRAAPFAAAAASPAKVPSSPVRGGRPILTASNTVPLSPTKPSPSSSSSSISSSFSRGTHGRSNSLLYSAARMPVPGWRDGALGADVGQQQQQSGENARPSSVRSIKAVFDGPAPAPWVASKGPTAPGAATGASAGPGGGGGEKKSILERAGVRHLGR